MNSRQVVVGAVSVFAFVAQAGRDGQVRNGDFEQCDSENHAVDWTYSSSFYTLEAAGGRNGTKGLAFDSRGDSRGSPIMQRVRATPGMRYHFGCWIRTEGLEGKGFCARVCLLWEDQFGRFIEGAYRTPHVRGSHADWVKCEGVSERTPAEAAWVTVRPEVVGPATGKAWFDDVFLDPHDTNPLLGVYTSAYRDEQSDGDVTLGAALSFVGSGVEQGDCRHLFTWKASDGKAVAREAEEVQPDAARLTLPVAEIALGESDVAFSLVRRSDGTEVSRKACRFCRAEEARPRRVSFDRLGRTIVDGKPFFPLGMYWSIPKPYHAFKLPPISASNIVEFAKGPFNCTMPYLSPTREQLDLCASNGIKVIYTLLNDFPGNVWDPSGANPKLRHSPHAARRIAAFKDHPALLAWYLNDEKDLRELESLRGRYRTVRELDPDHPAWIAVYQYDQIADYLPTFDVFGTDPYPIPDQPVGIVSEWSRRGLDGALRMRPMWQVVQAFDWATFRSGKKGDRMPTRAEMKNMTWQSIAGGANGLVYYSYTYLAFSPTTPFEKGWADVCAAAREVKENFGVLLSGDVPPPFAVSTADVSVRTWKDGRRVYVLAVNRTRAEALAAVTLDGVASLEKTLLQDGEVRVGGGQLTFRLPGLGRTLVEVGMSR